MKFLIYQYSDNLSKYAELSKKSVKTYADKIRADYVFLDSGAPISYYYGIFVPFIEKKFYEYDYMCFIDTDVLINKNYDDIRLYLDENSINAVKLKFKTITKELNNNPDRPDFYSFIKTNGYINSGVVVFPKKLYGVLEKYVINLEQLHNNSMDSTGKIIASYDQAILNQFIYETGLLHELPEKFNYTLRNNSNSERFKASLIHYNGKSYKSFIMSDYKRLNRILK
jgi:alpha-N-acetylglucosamine transferase